MGDQFSACPFAVVSITALTAVARPTKTPLLILRVLLGHAARTDTFFIGVAAFEEKRGGVRERTGSMIMYTCIDEHSYM